MHEAPSIHAPLASLLALPIAHSVVPAKSRESISIYSGRRRAAAMVPLLALLLLCSPRSLAGVSSEPPPPYRWVDLNLRDLGAKEGAANWPATSAAIRAGVAAVRRAGGGTLRIPAGQFTAAPFNMTSNMTLYLERGAVLLGTSVFAAHPIVPPLPSYGSGRDHAHGNRRTSLIHGEHLENVKVLGDWGTIDGNGAQWWAAHTNHSEGSVTRGSLIEFMYCEGVEISHLHLKDSPFWTGMRPLAAIDRWLLCSACVPPVHQSGSYSSICVRSPPVRQPPRARPRRQHLVATWLAQHRRSGSRFVPGCRD
jgi:hypothetical protein